MDPASAAGSVSAVGPTSAGSFLVSSERLIAGDSLQFAGANSASGS